MTTENLIPCTVELERLKIFLRVLSQLKKNAVRRRFFDDKYYKDLPLVVRCVKLAKFLAHVR